MCVPGVIMIYKLNDRIRHIYNQAAPEIHTLYSDIYDGVEKTLQVCVRCLCRLLSTWQMKIL